MGCKVILVLFNYCVMANFFWLLVEGLYLHTLLLIIHNASVRLSFYMLIGWGRLQTEEIRSFLHEMFSYIFIRADGRWRVEDQVFFTVISK